MPQGILLKQIKLVPKVREMRFSENDELLVVIGSLLSIIKIERNITSTITSEPQVLYQKNVNQKLIEGRKIFYLFRYDRRDIFMYW
jgi:hypothetical protein